jgi:hypothetical protein
LVIYDQNVGSVVLPVVYSDDLGCYIIDEKEASYWCAKCKTYRRARNNGNCRWCGSKIAP